MMTPQRLGESPWSALWQAYCAISKVAAYWLLTYPRHGVNGIFYIRRREEAERAARKAKLEAELERKKRYVCPTQNNRIVESDCMRG